MPKPTYNIAPLNAAINNFNGDRTNKAKAFALLKAVADLKQEISDAIAAEKEARADEAFNAMGIDEQIKVVFAELLKESVLRTLNVNNFAQAVRNMEYIFTAHRVSLEDYVSAESFEEQKYLVTDLLSYIAPLQHDIAQTAEKVGSAEIAAIRHQEQQEQQEQREQWQRFRARFLKGLIGALLLIAAISALALVVAAAVPVIANFVAALGLTAILAPLLANLGLTIGLGVLALAALFVAISLFRAVDLDVSIAQLFKANGQFLQQLFGRKAETTHDLAGGDEPAAAPPPARQLPAALPVKAGAVDSGRVLTSTAAPAKPTDDSPGSSPGSSA